MRYAPLLLLVATLPLAACDGGDGNGTQISIRTEGGDGNVTASADENGSMAIKLPGFEGKIKLPPLQIKAEDFEVNGVKLYPQSRIVTMDVNARDDGKDNKDQGTVRLAFESPARLETVRHWFQDQMAKHSFHVQQSGTGLSGTTDEGDPFTLTLTPGEGERTKGTLRVQQD